MSFFFLGSVRAPRKKSIGIETRSKKQFPELLSFLLTCGLSRSINATSAEEGRADALDDPNKEREEREAAPIDDEADDRPSSATARTPVEPHQDAAPEGGPSPSRATAARTSRSSGGGDAIAFSCEGARKERERKERNFREKMKTQNSTFG